MWNTWLDKPEPIGCHFGADRVRLAQVRGLAKGRPLLALAEGPLPDVADADPAYCQAVTDIVRGMLRSAPFRGSRVVSALPPGAARYATMRLAPMPAEELARAAHWKLSTELGARADTFQSAVLNVNTIREGGKQRTEALVVSATLDRLERHVAALAGLGLEHVAIDDTVCAVARCVATASPTGAGAPDRRVVLELREDDAFFAVATGPELACIRPVGLGLSYLTKTLADLLEVPPAEARELHARVLAGPDAAAARAVPGPAHGRSPVPVERVREAVADASRMYGRELARLIALSTYYYANALGTTAPDTGILVSDRALDPAVLEAVTVQSGIDLTLFEPMGNPWGTQHGAAAGPSQLGSWAPAIGLSLYANELAPAKEAA